MAEKAKELQTDIVLGGKVDGSFDLVHKKLKEVKSTIDIMGKGFTSMHNSISGLTEPMIRLGKASLAEFSKYDDIMREVQALGQLSKTARSELDEYNKAIAQSSRYTMEMTGNAEKLMAQLGLTMKQQAELMPTVMNLATAANIELADSLDYLYYSLNALGKPMDYVSTLGDQMSLTAARTAADIDTLGKSLQRLGSSSQFFTGGSSEILAILGGIAGYGRDMQGESAGLQLRNFMLTLLAPTASKEALLNELQLSEADYAEFEDYISDAGIDFTQSAGEMQRIGFSAYDENGRLKSGINIIGDLQNALSGMSEAERNKTLGTLFGKRTTVTAMNLLDSYDNIRALQGEIEGNSTGYTQYMADIIEGGIGGSRRRLDAGISALETTIGDAFDEEAVGAIDSVTDMVNSITNMDSGKMKAMVKGFGTFALTGPALGVIGKGFSIISHLFTPGGVAALTIAGMAGLVTALDEMQEQAMENHFGTLEVDMQAVGVRLAEINDELKVGAGAYDEYRTAVDEASTAYQEASTALAEDLLTAYITGDTLSKDEQDNLIALGDEMGKALIKGIQGSYDASSEFLYDTFGGDGVAENDETYRDIIDVLFAGYEDSLGKAEEIGNGMRDAMFKAFEDGVVSSEEYRELQEWFEAYNQAMADAMNDARDEQEYIDRQRLLKRAQTMSLDSFGDLYTEISGQKQTAVNDYLYDADTEWFRIQRQMERQGRREDEIARAKADYYSNISINSANKGAEYDSLAINSAMAALIGSDQGTAFGNVLDIAERVTSGQLSVADARDTYDREFGGDTVELFDMIEEIVATFGGRTALQKAMEEYSAAGNTDLATQYGNLLTAYGIAGSFGHDIKTNLHVNGMMGIGDEGEYEKLLSPITMPVEMEDPTQEVDNALSTAQKELNANPLTMTYRLFGGGGLGGSNLQKYAEGGRATQASIFGEAGAEWAIPEEHSQRTAELLDQARAASGFTWLDLLSRTGGLNSGGSYTGGTLVYSPTIYANDATDVEQKLREDKERMEAWYEGRNRQRRAVAYR